MDGGDCLPSRSNSPAGTTSIGQTSGLLATKPRGILGCCAAQPRRLEDEMFQDLLFGPRMLRRKPGFPRSPSLSLAAELVQTRSSSRSSIALIIVLFRSGRLNNS